MSQEEELEAIVDPSSLTVVLHAGELAIMPVDCDPGTWAKAAVQVPCLDAWPLPDGRVVVQRV